MNKSDDANIFRMRGRDSTARDVEIKRHQLPFPTLVPRERNRLTESPGGKRTNAGGIIDGVLGQPRPKKTKHAVSVSSAAGDIGAGIGLPGRDLATPGFTNQAQLSLVTRIADRNFGKSKNRAQDLHRW